MTLTYMNMNPKKSLKPNYVLKEVEYKTRSDKQLNKLLVTAQSN